MRMGGPRVSSLIGTYNYGHYVEQAVDNALAQDFPRENFEILVHDSSTDDTPLRLQKYGDVIRYLRKLNGGQASAFKFPERSSDWEDIVDLHGDPTHAASISFAANLATIACVI